MTERACNRRQDKIEGTNEHGVVRCEGIDVQRVGGANQKMNKRIREGGGVL